MGLLDRRHIVDVRASAILTGDYVAGNIIGPASSGVYKLDCQGFNQLKVIFDLTIGSLDSVNIKIEFSEDGTTYSQYTGKDYSAGKETLALATQELPKATGKYESLIPITTRFIKISAQGVGTVTNSLLAIDAVLSVV